MLLTLSNVININGEIMIGSIPVKMTVNKSSGQSLLTVPKEIAHTFSQNAVFMCELTPQGDILYKYQVSDKRITSVLLCTHIELTKKLVKTIALLEMSMDISTELEPKQNFENFKCVFRELYLITNGAILNIEISAPDLNNELETFFKENIPVIVDGEAIQKPIKLAQHYMREIYNPNYTIQ
jgi:hypothetical protein